MIRRVRCSVLDAMVLRSTRHPVEFAPKSRVVFPGVLGDMECFGGRVGDGWLSELEDSATASPDLIILKFPGTAGRAERASPFPANVLSDVRSEVFSWNPPGYGGSQGKASLAGIAAAALEVLDAITERCARSPDLGENPKVWVCGNSLGCASALYVASRRPQVDALILRNPPPLIDTVKRVARRYPLGFLFDAIAESLCDEMNALLTAPDVSCPAIFLRSGSDELVLPEMQQKIMKVYGGTYDVVELEGLSHGGLASKTQQREIDAAVKRLWVTTQAHRKENVG